MTWAIFPDEAHRQAIRELMTTNSERVIAVVGGALLEEAVDRTLIERLRDNSTLVDSLTTPDGALGAMGAKINLLCLLGAFDEDKRIAISRLAKVRNFFAHNLDASFESADPEFADHMRRLTLHAGKTHYPYHLYGPDFVYAIEPINSPRDKFLVNLKLALLYLMRDRCSHDTYTNTTWTDEQLHERYGAQREADERQALAAASSAAGPRTSTS